MDSARLEPSARPRGHQHCARARRAAILTRPAPAPTFRRCSRPQPLKTLRLSLHAGLAFGTGDHPTTRLCLRWLRRLQREGALSGTSVMDYGTGSGVLAVAALLMGAGRAAGTDVEPLAVKAARANARLNGVDGRLAAYQCGGAPCAAIGKLLLRPRGMPVRADWPLPRPAARPQRTLAQRSRWRQWACRRSSGHST